jgi:integrase
MTIKFFIQAKKNPSPVYVRVCDGKNDAKAKTNLVYNFSEWSNISGKPKNQKDEKGKVMVNDLETIRSIITKEYNKVQGKRAVNSEWLKEVLNPRQTVNDIPTSLVKYFDYYAESKKTSLKSSTHIKHNAYKLLIERFQKEMRRDYLINEVDNTFKLLLEKYCFGQNYSHNYICKLITVVKTICFHAERNGIELNKATKYITVKFQPVEKIYLPKHELAIIEQAELPHDYLINTRKWLLISAETGQRVSDFLRFKKEMIRYEKGVPLIEFTQAKTGKLMSIPLTKKVINILNQNGGEFPREISDQKYNEYLKEVCEIAGLTTLCKGRALNPKTNLKELGFYPKWQLVSSHIGRRSFATNNYGIIPTPLLMFMTGHVKEESFLKYIGKTVNDLAFMLAEKLNEVYLSNV